MKQFLISSVSVFMWNRTLTGMALAVALAASPLRSFGTTVQAPEFDQLVAQADYVVRATVKSIDSAWREKDGHRFIASRVTLDVKEVIRGTPPSPLVLDMVGGTVGDDTLTVEGAPKFHVGDENILFVHGNGTVFYPLVAVMHGVYPIFRDRQTGREYALRSNGMPLYSENDVSLPMTKLSAVKVQNPSAQPMTASEFAAKIRAARPGETRTQIER
ncbi:MAG TPA: hypothetical protein VL200_09745 [Lacunisphaera sp.]|nr:hypothetical protein [Lacunisphaera sp.]